MAKHVIIFGAGASVPVGGPTMANFLDVAQDLWASGVVGKHARSFENVFDAISSLQTVHSKSEFDLVNIESIFTAFELAKLLGRFPNREAEDLDKLIQDLKTVIVVTLEHRIPYPLAVNRVGEHDAFVNFLKKLTGRVRERSSESFALLTFNYDIVLDLAFYHADIPVNYGLADDAVQHGIPLLKLHGSLNWAVEYESKKVVPWPLASFLGGTERSVVTARRFRQVDDRRFVLNIGSEIWNYQSYSKDAKQVDPLPVIVPPSWNKADSHKSISRVWSRAAKELTEADSIYVVGYSLPNTDSFFRQLYALGTVGRVPLKRFWVFNPDKSREQVFQGLLGPGARSRFRFFDQGVEAALNTIADPGK